MSGSSRRWTDSTGQNIKLHFFLHETFMLKAQTIQCSSKLSLITVISNWCLEFFSFMAETDFYTCVNVGI